MLDNSDLIAEGETITLDDGIKYLCTLTAEQNGKHYLYLVGIEAPNPVCFAEQSGATVRVINNHDEKQSLLETFQNLIVNDGSSKNAE